MMSQTRDIPLQEAAFIAIKALAYISQIEAEMLKFLNETGVQTADVIRLKENLDFLAGVLDFVNRDETLLMAFVASEGFEVSQIDGARRALLAVSENKA